MTGRSNQLLWASFRLEWHTEGVPRSPYAPGLDLPEGDRMYRRRGLSVPLVITDAGDGWTTATVALGEPEDVETLWIPSGLPWAEARKHLVAQVQRALRKIEGCPAANLRHVIEARIGETHPPLGWGPQPHRVASMRGRVSVQASRLGHTWRVEARRGWGSRFTAHRSTLAVEALVISRVPNALAKEAALEALRSVETPPDTAFELARELGGRLWGLL